MRISGSSHSKSWGRAGALAGLVGAAVAFGVLAGCPADDDDDSEIDVSGTYDESVDFSAYKTYAIVQADDDPKDERTPPAAYLESNRIAVIQSIMHEMAARGYILDTSNPDLRISPFVRLRDIDVTVAQPYWYDYYYGYYWGYGYPWYTWDVVHLEEGTLIIDAVDVGIPDDPEDDKLVFRGHATGILPPQPTDISNQIPGIVAKIFRFWPPVDDAK